MEDYSVIDFEKRVHKDLYEYLKWKKAIDDHLPECPDVEEKWDKILAEYLPDGVREYQEFPVTSLGWMMFMGMAMAYYWDTDWEKYSKEENYYIPLRDKAGYDNFDQTVVEDLLGFKGEKAEEISAQVADCASRVFGILSHEPVEPGTELAFRYYVAALHQLYLMGMCIELNALGYHMTPYNPASLN